VEDFEPVPCEHRFGPSFHLSDADLHKFNDTVRSLRSGRRQGLSVLGFYRSHTRPGFVLDDEDLCLLSRYFSETNTVLLVIKPLGMQESLAALFCWDNLQLRRVSEPAPFPFEETPMSGLAGLAAPVALADFSTAAPAAQAVAWRLPAAPTPERRAARKRAWTALAAVLALVGGLLGYWSLRQTWENSERPVAREVTRPDPKPAPPAPLESLAPEQRAAAPTAPESSGDRLAEERQPEVPPMRDGDSGQIRALLNRWTRALKRGDPGTVAHLYAPRLKTYLTARNATRNDVRRHVRQMSGKYGKLAFIRIDNLSISPRGRNQAVATFRKHWQTSGLKRASGKENARLTLVKENGRWQIASEEEIPLDSLLGQR
jgi:uncharacterized protein (TIGR02246 family)